MLAFLTRLAEWRWGPETREESPVRMRSPGRVIAQLLLYARARRPFELFSAANHVIHSAGLCPKS